MIKLSKEAYNYYRNNINGRQSISFEEAEKVLNRNIILGDYFRNKNYCRVYYGKLLIIIKDKTIIAIKNKTSHQGKINPLAKKLLNTLLGIGE